MPRTTTAFSETQEDEPHYCTREPTPAEKRLVSEFLAKYLRSLAGHNVRGLRCGGVRWRLESRLLQMLLGCAYSHMNSAPEWQDFELLAGATCAAFEIFAAAKGVRLP
jgi:hypothetical protein